MASKVYTFASAKGGSGKTLLTATFAAFLSELNKKVLIIDSDTSTNGLTLMYLKEVSIHKEIIISKGRKPKGIFDLIDKDNEFEHDFIDIVKLNNGVSLIPATFIFENVNGNVVDRYFENITFILNKFRQEFDYIFIDAQAGSDEYAAVSINKQVSDEVIIVSEYDPLSAAGVERLKGIFRDDLTYNRTWYLLNKMIPEFIQSFSDFLEIAKYLNPIPWDADVVRAYARRKLPLDLDNGNEFTLAIIQTIKTLLGEEMSKEIDIWKMKKEDMFKQPIDEQSQILHRKLYEINRKEKNKKIKIISYLTIGSILFISLLFTIVFYIFPDSGDLFKKDFFTGFTILISLGAIIFTFARLLFKENYYGSIEKDVIYDKLKKLESLKYSDFDKIVRDRDARKSKKEV